MDNTKKTNSTPAWANNLQRAADITTTWPSWKRGYKLTKYSGMGAPAPAASASIGDDPQFRELLGALDEANDRAGNFANPAGDQEAEAAWNALIAHIDQWKDTAVAKAYALGAEHAYAESRKRAGRAAPAPVSAPSMAEKMVAVVMSELDAAPVSAAEQADGEPSRPRWPQTNAAITAHVKAFAHEMLPELQPTPQRARQQEVDGQEMPALPVDREKFANWTRAEQDAYEEGARAALAMRQPQGEREYKVAGEAKAMPGTNGGFTMCVFKAADVPSGALLFTGVEGAAKQAGKEPPHD
jgi:hypothetical protein